ncbi:MAG: tetratricopeptide repeat protein [Candidatus Omnitrophota bacterium]
MKKTSIHILRIVITGLFVLCHFTGFAENETPADDREIQQAIWQYKHENYEEAYELLRKLIKENPDSSMVAYYFGVTCKQLQNYEEARSALEAAVILKPKIKNALIELIELLYKKGDLDEAEKWIEVAEKESIYPAQTAFFKGLILLKKGEDMDAAITSLDRARTCDMSLSKTVDYYIGLARVKAKDMSGAKEIFREIVRRDPNTSLASFANQYIDAINRKEEAERPFRGSIGAAVQYDDNVLLMPDDETIGVGAENQSDWRQVYTLNGEYNMKVSDNFGAKAGYSFYCGKQFDLGFYDMVSNNFFIQPAFYLDKAAASFPFTYNIVQVNDKNYLSLFSLGNLDNIKIAEDQLGQFSFTYRNKKYLWAPSGPGEDRDSNEYMGHIAWFYFFADNRAFACLRYSANYDDTEEQNWRYFGNKITIAASIPLAEKLTLGVTAEYFLQYYTDTNLIFNKRREDGVFTYSSVLSYEIFKNAEVQFNYTCVDDVSNIQVYKYTRNVYSLGIKYSF